MATGDFELLALIAEGGQGAVHLVWDRARGEPRALKLWAAAPRPGESDDAALARGLASLRPLVGLAFEAVGAERELPAGLRERLARGGPPRLFASMRYFHGPSLAELSRAAGPLSAAEVAAVGRGIAEGLLALEAKGRHHLDVKTDNVLVTLAGELGLVDPAIGDGAGTPGWAAPEQAEGKGGGPADVYGLGAVMLALLVGEPPGPEGPVPLLGRLPEPDAPLAQLVRECLYTKAEKRPGLAQLVERLPGEWASQLAALVRRVGPGPRVSALANALGAQRSPAPRGEATPGGFGGDGPPRAPSRRKLAVFGAALGAVLLLLGAGAFFALRPRAPPPPPLDYSARARGIPLRPGELPPKGLGGFQITVVNPEGRIAVTNYGGDLVWEQRQPKLGESYKIALPPDEYLYVQESSLPSSAEQEFALSIRHVGDTVFWKTPRYELRAPRPSGLRPNPADGSEPYGPLTAAESRALTDPALREILSKPREP